MATPPKTKSPRTGGKAAAQPPSEEDAEFTEAPDGEVTLHKRELFARVAEATEMKKPQVKQIVEATLAILGQALANGEALNLPPLGKVRIVRSRDAGAAEVMTLKLRRKGGAAVAAAEDEES